jgi:uncharacterized protein DUF6984
VNDIREIAPPRKLTEIEAGILQLLLSPAFAGRDDLQRQAKVARVRGMCSCGCPSIILFVESSLAPPANVKRRIPIEAEGTDLDGMPIHFLLHVVDGYLSEIEVYREDSRPVLDLPDPSSLKLFSLDDP